MQELIDLFITLTEEEQKEVLIYMECHYGREKQDKC